MVVSEGCVRVLRGVRACPHCFSCVAVLYYNVVLCSHCVAVVVVGHLVSCCVLTTLLCVQSSCCMHPTYVLLYAPCFVACVTWLLLLLVLHGLGYFAKNVDAGAVTMPAECVFVCATTPCSLCFRGGCGGAVLLLAGSCFCSLVLLPDQPLMQLVCRGAKSCGVCVTDVCPARRRYACR